MEAGEAPPTPRVPDSPTKTNGKREAGSPPPQPTRRDDNNSDSEDEIPLKHNGTYKQLWPVLLGKTELLDLEIVHDQLSSRRDDLLACYVYQNKPFTALPLKENSSFKDMFINAWANKWMVPESVALQVFMDYIMFEYNGAETGVTELLSSSRIHEKIMTEVDNFYHNERLCKLYCTQVILGQATDVSKTYNHLFAEFITSPGTLENWTETICLSFDRASNDNERIQILHTLAILLAENAEFDEVMQRFVESFKPPEENRASRNILLAEAVLMYAFLQSGQDDKNGLITKYLNAHGMDLLENQYLLGAYICAFKDRCQENSDVSRFIRSAPNPRKCVQSMIELLEEYEAESFRNKHGLHDIIARAVAFAAEIIMGSYNKECFGSSTDWLKLFCTLMRNPTISSTFLRERSPELQSLYEDYAYRFPVDADSVLQCWGALLTGGSPSSSTAEILQDLINTINIAERLEDAEFVQVKHPQNVWETTQNRHILGVTIPAGTLATVIANDVTPKLLVWNIAPSVHAIDVWRIYFNLICSQPPQNGASDSDSSTDSELKLTCTATDFLLSYLRQTANIPEHMLDFSSVVGDAIFRFVLSETDKRKKSRLLGRYISLLQSLSTFDSKVFLARAFGLMPNPGEDTLISHQIICLESLSESDLSVTLAFLDLVGQLFRPKLPKTSPFNISEEMPSQFKSYYIYAIQFICENILPGLLHWRIHVEDRRHELFIRCLRIFINLFSVHEKWASLKDMACEQLVSSKSPLLYILTTTDEYAVQESMIKTNSNNRKIPRVVDLALNLIVKLANYKREILHELDNHSGLALVQKLGRLLRHRVNTVIPTLSVLLLKKIAEESNMSMLCCLGEDVDPFCDHVVQRLRFQTEDTQLKACILDFLTVCAQTQLALIHRLMDDSTQDALLDQVFIFLAENDSNLVISSCAFIRALIVTENALLRKYRPNIWGTIFIPLKQISKFLNQQVRKKIIATTLNSFSYEIHRRGFLDPNFDIELKDLFRGNQWHLITEAALEGKDEDTTKCALAIKHFLILLHGSNESSIQQHYGGPLQSMLEQITEAFWLEKEMETSSANFRSTLAEIMVVLAPSAPDRYLEGFCVKLSEHFFTDAVGVQLPLLSCVNKCLLKENSLAATSLESIVKIISKILEHDTSLFSTNSPREIHVLYILAVRIISSIIRSKAKLPSEWPKILQRNTIVASIVKLVNKGLQRGEVPDFLHECLDTLIGLANNPVTSTLVRCSDLSCNLWLPIVNYVMKVQAGEEPKWMGIYTKFFQLNTALIVTESQYYMNDAIEFWVLHALLLSQKLDGLTYLINHCLLDPDNKAFGKITSHLDLVTSGCWSVVATLPYLKDWRIRDGPKVAPLMQSCVAAVNTAASLLSSPHNLMLLITTPFLQPTTASFSAAAHFRLTPELLELQHKLWEFINATVNVFWKIQKDPTLLNFKPFYAALTTTMKIAVKTLTRTQGERRPSQRSVMNDMEKVMTSLEKCFGVLLCRITMKLEELQNAQDEELDDSMEEEDSILEFKKEISPEIMSLCEGIRGCTPEHDVLYRLCSVMEELIQIPTIEA